VWALVNTDTAISGPVLTMRSAEKTGANYFFLKPQAFTKDSFTFPHARGLGLVPGLPGHEK